MVNIGIDQEYLEKVSKAMSQVLANTALLSMKTKGFHWNIVGSDFYQLHKFLEEQYEKLDEAIDALAERIRALGYRAPGSYKEFQNLAEIQENGKPLSSAQMVDQLLKDHEFIIQKIRKIIDDLEDDSKDFESMDMLTQRLTEHGEAAWMLRSTNSKQNS